ncbi:MAG: tetratricopeptide repeat protein, partial [Cyanobacteria bacterium CAN_BIN43]|nr:tetratricopeptide repeat protein [Cyanobacteria bacterium CAN_BIN43]
TASLTSSVNKAEALMRKGQWAQARDILEALDEQYPDEEEVLRLLAALNYQIQDFTEYQIICRRLSQLKPDDAGLTLALGGAYMTGARTTLALQAFQKFLERSPNHPKAAEIRDAVTKLEEITERVIAELDLGESLTPEQGLEVAALHELAQLYMADGDVEAGQQVSEQLLQIHPNYLPARNNLSLMIALGGNWEEAIAVAQSVLEADPENAHALSNLARYQRLSGHSDLSQQTVIRLKAIASDKPDIWQKQAEALSFMGDYPGVLEVFHQAEAISEAPLPPLLYHLAAVAMLRLGKERQAREYWQKALEISPDFDLAEDNLADLQQSVTQRQSPWSFPLNYWISPQATDDVFLLQEAAQSNNEDNLRAATQQYLQNHPEVETLIPMLLDQGDGAGRQLALNLALMTDKPEMHQILKDFALSQSGSDKMRQQAAQVVARTLRDSEMRLWMAGEWRDVTLLGYELHEEVLHNHSPEVDKLTRQAIAALKEGNWTKAEHPLKQALKLEPTAPDLGYNLAAAYERQGKPAEALAIVQSLHQQDPDYAFARIAIARS